MGSSRVPLAAEIIARLEDRNVEARLERTENYRGAFTDSYMEFLKGLYAKKNPRHYRFIGATQFGNEVVDRSVQQRRKTDLSYEPQNNGLPKLT